MPLVSLAGRIISRDCGSRHTERDGDSWLDWPLSTEDLYPDDFPGLLAHFFDDREWILELHHLGQALLER